MLWYSWLLFSCLHWKIGPYSVMISRFEGFCSVSLLVCGFNHRFWMELKSGFQNVDLCSLLNSWWLQLNTSCHCHVGRSTSASFSATSVMFSTSSVFQDRMSVFKMFPKCYIFLHLICFTCRSIQFYLYNAKLQQMSSQGTSMIWSNSGQLEFISM